MILGNLWKSLILKLGIKSKCAPSVCSNGKAFGQASSSKAFPWWKNKRKAVGKVSNHTLKWGENVWIFPRIKRQNKALMQCIWMFRLKWVITGSSWKSIKSKWKCAKSVEMEKKKLQNERKRKEKQARLNVVAFFFLSVTQLHIYFYINDVSSCGCCFNLNI